jgi:hypothetical protein
MHDYDLDLAKQSPRRTPDPATADRAADAGTAPTTHGAHLDAASLMHLQRTVGNAGVVQLLAEDEAAAGSSPVTDVVGKGGGTPLEDSTRTSMEDRFGQSFDDVRVHTDTRASQSAESVGANAYTVGSDIVFRSGQFDASSPTGQRTIAHELAHVVQQRAGPVDGTEAPGGIKLSDPSDKFEQAAEQTASEIMSTPAAAQTATPADASAQRELDEDADAVQMLVQRQTPEEEEEEMPA